MSSRCDPPPFFEKEEAELLESDNPYIFYCGHDITCVKIGGNWAVVNSMSPNIKGNLLNKDQLNQIATFRDGLKIKI